MINKSDFLRWCEEIARAAASFGPQCCLVIDEVEVDIPLSNARYEDLFEYVSNVSKALLNGGHIDEDFALASVLFRVYPLPEDDV